MSKAARRRRRWYIVGGVLALLVLGAVAFGISLRAAARDVQAHAAAAQAELGAARTALTIGDPTGAGAAADRAAAEVQMARDSASSPSVRVLGVIPVASQVVDDLDRLITAAGLVTSASQQLVSVYDEMSGGPTSPSPLFTDGQIDLDELAKLSFDLDSVGETLTRAESTLREVDATLPMTGSMAAARDVALAEVHPLLATITRASDVLPSVPAALGAGKARQYLVVVLNQAEMRAGGGAPLSLALLRFANGRMTIPVRGQLSLLPNPGLGVLTWKGSDGSPWNSPSGFRTAVFTNANFHPDFRSAGVDLARAWRAGGGQRVDGVIAVDTTAIAAVLRATGPIESPAFGELTADNLGQKLLVDAYRAYSDDQLSRLKGNEVLMDLMLPRLSSGAGFLGTVRALASTAPGRHVQMYVSDPALADQLHELGLDGAVESAVGDTTGVFLQNANASKVDVFNTRAITIDARIAPDGSASVTQTVTVTNAIPESLPVTRDRIGYTTTWSKDAYFLYRPNNAEDVEITLPPSFIVFPWQPGDDWSDDGHGHLMTRIVGPLAPRTSATISVRYSLPAGTFRLPDGHLAYTVSTNPAPTWQPPALTITATGPAGTPVTQSLVLDSHVVVEVPVS